MLIFLGVPWDKQLVIVLIHAEPSIVTVSSHVPQMEWWHILVP